MTCHYVIALLVAASWANVVTGLPANADAVVPEEVLPEVSQRDHQLDVTPEELDGEPITVTDLPAGAEIFLHQAMSSMREMCGKTGSFTGIISDISMQMVQGEEFTLKYNVSDTDTSVVHEVQLRWLLPGNQGIHEMPGRSPSIADQFDIDGVTPRVCPTHEMRASDAATTANLLQMSRAKGFIGKDPSTVPASMIDAHDITAKEAAALPQDFDWRQFTKGARAIDATISQGSCGSCYAFASTTAFAYRLFIKSGGRHDVWPSPQTAMSCYHYTTDSGDAKGGCEGGDAQYVYGLMEQGDGFPPMWCNPYNFTHPEEQKPTQCNAGCSDALRFNALPGGTKLIGHAFLPHHSQKEVEHMIMREIYHNGPAFLSVEATEDFQRLSSWDIWSRKEEQGMKKIGNHAVVLVGWGVEQDDNNNNKPYWIIQNSYGNHWGNGGFARLARGVNQNALEHNGIATVTPVIPDKCMEAKVCANSGSYNNDCTCHCIDGFSGPTCEECSLPCEFGKSSVKDGKCVCDCAPFTYSLGGVTCSAKLHVASHYSSTSLTDVFVKSEAKIHVLANAAGKAGITGKDYFVAVKTGEKPHSPAGFAEGVVMKFADGEGDIGNIAGVDRYSNCHKFSCGAEWMQRSCQKKCGPYSPTLEGLAPGVTYDLYLYKFLGHSEFGVPKGWGQALKLSQRVYSIACYDDHHQHCESYLGDEYGWSCDTALSGAHEGKTVADLCAKSCGTCWTGSPAPMPLSIKDKHAKAAQEAKLHLDDRKEILLESKSNVAAVKARAEELEADTAKAAEAVSQLQAQLAAAEATKTKNQIASENEQLMVETLQEKMTENEHAVEDAQDAVHEVDEKQLTHARAQAEEDQKEAAVKAQRAVAKTKEVAAKVKVDAAHGASTAAKEKEALDAAAEVEEKKSVLMTTQQNEAKAKKAVQEMDALHVASLASEKKAKDAEKQQAEKVREDARNAFEGSVKAAQTATASKLKAVGVAEGKAEALEKEKRVCMTTGKVPCDFPFKYGGVEHQECTSMHHDQAWCITDTGKGTWGNCDDCPSLHDINIETSQKTLAKETVSELKTKHAEAMANEPDEAHEMTIKQQAADKENDTKAKASDIAHHRHEGILSDKVSHESQAQGLQKELPGLKQQLHDAKTSEAAIKKKMKQAYEACTHTSGGTADGDACMFPYKAGGKQRYACTSYDGYKPWCLTVKRDWGYCPEGCPVE